MKDHHKNPIPTVDIIIEENSRIVLIKRRNEPFKDHLALPGGFVNEGEKVEDAAKREAQEETSLHVDLIDILGVYSDPNRDPRGHNMSTVFIGRCFHKNSNEIKAVAKDDAVEIEWVSIDAVGDKNLGFDHKQILLDYKKWKKFGGTFWSSKCGI
ncbi:MAG TPA: NUDIX hydrolase [Candidatus Bathyarchaeia archaeon]|nr:NUDIX hydrolase [Candidatus Bathyarchaeia archaeon]